MMLLPLCRDTIRNNRAPVSSLKKLSQHADLRKEHIEFALEVIQAYGDRSDLLVLVPLLEDPLHCEIAIKAARAIESR
jgi:hypothetical protein